MNRIVPLIFWAGTVWSGSAADPLTTAPPVEAGPNMGASILRLLGALALVLALFFVFAWGMRHWQQYVFRSNAPTRLHVIEARSLGQRNMLYVVGYDQERLLIAASPTQVTLLTRLPPADNVSATTPPAAAPSFAETLRHLWGSKA